LEQRNEEVILIRGLIAILALTLISCRSGVILRETPLNMSETRRVITMIIGQPRAISKDGRELSSHYYDRQNKPIENPKAVRERYTTVIAILGDRRPYDVEVEVLREVRAPEGGYEVIENDESRAQAIGDRLQKALNESRDNRNLIDDFRPY